MLPHHYACFQFVHPQGKCAKQAVLSERLKCADWACGCRFWPVRTYPWGKCEALSSTNSDLSSLKRLLFEEGFVGLKQATEERYYRYQCDTFALDNRRQDLASSIGFTVIHNAIPILDASMCVAKRSTYSICGTHVQ